MQPLGIGFIVVSIISLIAVTLSIVALVDAQGHGVNGSLSAAEITEIQNLLLNVQIVNGILEAKGFSTAFSPSSMLNAASSDPETNLVANQFTLIDNQERQFTIAQDSAGNGLLTSVSATQFGSAFGYFKVTTAERLAITPTEGMSVLDTDVNAVFVYINGMWTSLSSTVVTGTSGQIDVSGNMISLADFGPGANSYTLASITLDAKGRIASASNGSAVLSVSGTLNEIDVTAGVNPVVSLDPAVTASISAKVSRSGDTMTGALIGVSGSASAPGLAIGTSSNGMYASTTNNVDFATAGAQRVNINAVGTMSVNSLGTGTAGVVHATTVGGLSTSLIVNADITDTTITNAKLLEKDSANTANFLVQRDGSGKFTTTMITLTGTVTNDTDAATKAYVDTAASAGLVVHPPVIAVAVVNVTQSGDQKIDNIDVTAGDRVLLTFQSSSSADANNGPWVVQAGAWTRPTDFDHGQTAGAAYFLVQQGDVYAATSWVCSTPATVIDNTPMTFSQFSQASPITGANVGTGTGHIFRDKTTNTLNFKTLLDGTYTQIANNADDIKLTLLAASANTNSFLVARDGSGNFSASQITATALRCPSVDATATALNLGTSVATSVILGSLSIPVSALGNSKIPVIDGNSGTLALGTTSVVTTAVSIGRSGITTTIAGTTSTGPLIASSISCATYDFAGAITIGASSASSVTIGAASIPLRSLGSSVLPIIDGNSGTLSLGITPVATTAVSIGRSGITTTINGTLVSGTTGVGALTATSVTSNTYDATSGTLTVGASTASAVTIGGASIPLNALGNSKIPTIDGNSGALSLGTNVASTAVNMGRSGIVTTVTGTLTAGTIDGAISLNIGTSSATAVHIGRQGIINDIRGRSTFTQTDGTNSTMTLSGASLSGSTSVINIDSTYSDGNYINVGAGGRNVGVDNSGNLFLTYNADYQHGGGFIQNPSNAATIVQLGATGSLGSSPVGGISVVSPFQAITWSTTAITFGVNPTYHSQPLSLTRFSQGATVTVNTTNETSLFGGSSVGSLTYAANTTNTGMVIRVTILGFYGTIGAGHTVVFKFKAGQSTTTLSTVTPGTGASVVGFKLIFTMTLRSGTSTILVSEYTQNNTIANNIMSEAVPTWTKTNSNAIDVTATLSSVASGDFLVSDAAYIETLGNT